MAIGRKKPAAKPESAKFPRKAIQVCAGETEEETGRNSARVATSPELAAFRVINGVEQNSVIGEHIDAPTMLEHLRDQAAAVNHGDLDQVEAMLVNQATALQSIFARLAERGMGCDNVAAFEANMRVALRAQSQCRAALETLATVKNPPVIYARQANVTTGPQQVNNGIRSHARENEIEQNKLLEQNDGERLDTGTASTAGSLDPDMATVG